MTKEVNTMIDTDKYEGHTEGPWFEVSGTIYHKEEGKWKHTVCSTAMNNVYIDREHRHRTAEHLDEHLANTQLITDAPLILEDYKRLRAVIEQHGIDISFDPKHNEEDEAILYEWLDATSQGYWGSVYEYKVMKQEELE